MVVSRLVPISYTVLFWNFSMYDFLFGLVLSTAINYPDNYQGGLGTQSELINRDGFNRQRLSTAPSPPPLHTHIIQQLPVLYMIEFRALISQDVFFFQFVKFSTWVQEWFICGIDFNRFAAFMGFCLFMRVWICQMFTLRYWMADLTLEQDLERPVSCHCLLIVL